MAKTRNINYQMTILSVIAIFFVVLGHINFPDIDATAPATLYGWFPYYSFHLPLFLFISGYFYKDLPEGQGFFRSFGRFLLKKIRAFVVPFYIINFLFWLFGKFILLPAGFTFSNLQPGTFWEFLISPWTKMYIVTFSVPMWYIIALFIAEIYFVLIRQFLKLFIKKELVREIVVLALSLGMGVVAVLLAERPDLSEPQMVYLRSVLMLFFIEFGVIYKKYLEQRDRLPSLPYFLLILLVQFIILVLTKDAPLSPGLYGLTSFGKGGNDYFAAGLTGLLLWLRVARIAASGTKQSKFLIFVGNNTKYIMSFHVFGFFLLNCIFWWMQNNSIGMDFLWGFNVKIFHAYLYYVYNENPRMNVLYVAAAMAFSLLMAWIIRTVPKLIRKLFKKRESLNTAA